MQVSVELVTTGGYHLFKRPQTLPQIQVYNAMSNLYIFSLFLVVYRTTRLKQLAQGQIIQWQKLNIADC